MGSDAPSPPAAPPPPSAAVAAAARAATAAAAAGRLRQPAAVQPVGPEQGGERRQPRRLPERQDEQVDSRPNYYGCHGSGSGCNCLYHCRHHGACCAYKPPEPPAVVEAPLILDAPPKELGAPTCAVGVRILTPEVPRAASLAARRWTARVHRGVGTDAARCAEITDKAECCAAVDTTGDVCVPAVTTFSDGSVCAGWVTTLLSGAASDRTAVATCPPHADAATGTARPRVRLPAGKGCREVRPRSLLGEWAHDAGHRRRAMRAGDTCSRAVPCGGGGDVAATYSGLPPTPPPPGAELEFVLVADTADGERVRHVKREEGAQRMARVEPGQVQAGRRDRYGEATCHRALCRWLVHDIAVRPHAPAG